MIDQGTLDRSSLAQEFKVNKTSSWTLGTVLLVSLLIVVSAAIYLLSDEDDTGTAGTLPETARGVETEDDVTLAEFEGDDAASGGVETDERLAVTPQKTATASTSTADLICVKARLLDNDGRPIEGVKVTQRSKGEDFQLLSGLDGRIEGDLKYFERPHEIRIPLKFEKRGYSRLSKSYYVASSKTVDLGDIVLGPGGAVAGQVLDTAGNPVSRASVMCTPGTVHESDLERFRIDGPRFLRFEGRRNTFSTRTEEDGSFQIDGVPAQKIRVWAGTKTMYYSCTEPFELPAGEEISGLILVLEPKPAEHRIEGVVLYPDGTPVPRARYHVSFEHKSGSGRSTSSTDQEGRFEYIVKGKYALIEEGTYSVKAYDREERYLAVEVKDVAPGTLDLVLQLTTLRPLILLSVHDEDGKAPESFEIKVYLESQKKRHAGDGFSDLYDHANNAYKIQPADLTKAGEAEISVPEQAFWLSVEADGFQTVELGPYDPRSAPGKLDVVLQPLPGIRGRVLAEGQPVEGASVRLHKPVTGNMEYEVDDFPCRSLEEAEASAKTDDDGRFCLWLRRSGTFYLRAEAEGRAPFELGPLFFDNTKKQDDLEITLTSGGVIEGTVRTSAGSGLGDLYVAISRGDGYAVCRRVGGERRFRFEHLTPGYWRVEKRDEDLRGGSSYSYSYSDTGKELGRQEDDFEWNCFVEDGKTTRFDLDLIDQMVCRLNGIFSIDGSIPANWNAFISKREAGTSDWVRSRLNPDGRFTLEGTEPGTYDLRLAGQMNDRVSVSVTDTVVLSMAEQSWVYELSSGKLDVHGARSLEGGRTEFRLEWCPGGDLVMTLRFTPDSKGFAHIPIAPSGKAALVRTYRDPETRNRREETLAEVDIAAGRTTTVRLE